MTYFVTGATGFIGRHLVEKLLEREGQIHVLVREGSSDKLDKLIESWGQPDRIVAVTGDLTEPRLGVSDEQQAELKGKVDHFFHLAALYDMTADDEANETANVGGTQHAIELANEIGAGTFHHVSSIAAAGLHKGLFREDMFDEGQKLDHPYHRTKFESEKLAREKVDGAWRVYRPAIVVGNSQTGEMDKIDGPYYFFTAIKALRHYLPEWVPLIGPELGYTNVVPVDFVADALDHIAHQPEPGRAGLPPHQPALAALGGRDERLRPRGPRAAPGHAGGQQAAGRAAQGHAVDADEAAAGQGRAPRGAGRPGHPRRACWSTWG